MFGDFGKKIQLENAGIKALMLIRAKIREFLRNSVEEIKTTTTRKLKLVGFN